LSLKREKEVRMNLKLKKRPEKKGRREKERHYSGDKSEKIGKNDFSQKLLLEGEKLTRQRRRRGQ